MADEEKQAPKIIVDEDWKQEAQREKEVLAAQEEEEKKKAQAEEGPRRPGPLPKGDLAALISMLTTQALYALGVLQVRGQEDHRPDLEMARYNVDMLEALEEKTKGNLTEAEEKALMSTLNELRMGYVQVANQAGEES